MARPSVATETILDAAAEVLAAHGVHRTTMEDIAAQAGVAKGVLYLRFEGKSALLRAVVDREFALALTATRAAVADDPRGGLLSRLFVHSLTALHTRPFLRALYAGSTPYLSNALRASRRDLYRPRLPIGTEFIGRMRRVGMVREDLDAEALAANLSIWNVGLAETAPHENLDELILGMGELVARAADRDVADTTPGKRCFARLADELAEVWSHS